MSSQSEPIVVGLLFSRTGVTSVIEGTQRQAALLAVEQINAAGGVAGRPLEVIDSDPASSAPRFRSEAARLLEAGARTIFGCYMSSTRKAILPLIEQHQALLFYPTLYEGFEFSPGCIYSGAVPNQNSRWLADYLIETYGTRFFFVGSNYVYPYETNRIMRDLLLNRGAEVLDEMYIPLDARDEDVARVIARLRARGPAVVFSTVVGEGCVRFYKAYHAAGFDRTRAPIASLTAGEPELMAIGPAAAAGNVTAAPYFSGLDTPANHSFVAAYRARFGANAPISAGSEAAYFQVQLFAEAVHRAGSSDRAAVLRALPTFTYEAPQGPVRVQANTHHTYLWPRVAVATETGAFRIVREATGPVAPDPYLIEYGDTPLQTPEVRITA